MKRTNTLIIYYLFILLSLINSLKANSSEAIRRVDVPGLSNNAVLYMHQDRDGNMWFGTYDGLNLYNGKNTITYRYEPDNQNSIDGNIIRKIFDAGPEHIWVTTFMGVNLISIKDKNVIASYTQYPETYHLASDNTGNTLLLSLDDFLSYSNPKMNSFIDIHVPGIRPGNIKDFFTDNDDQFYLFSSEGKLMKVILNKETPPIFCSIEEYLLHEEEIEIAFSDSGILYFIDKKNILYSYDCGQNLKTKIKDLTALMERYTGISKIIGWGTDIYLSFINSGLVKLSKDNDVYTEIPIKTGVFSLCKDRKQDILWMGTDGQGVQMYYKQQTIFRNFQPTFTQKPIRSIFTDEDGTLWIGTKGDGAFRIKNYDRSENEYPNEKDVSQYTIKNGLSHNFAFCFLKSNFRNVLWVGTEGPGLSYYSYRDEKMYSLRDSVFDGIMYVHSIQETNDTTLWVATVGKGLVRIILDSSYDNPRITKTDFFSFERNGRICNDFHSMILADKTTLILGSRGGHGVLRFNTISNKYDFIPSDQSETSAIGDVLSVYKSSSSQMYIGASSGMTKIAFHPEGKIIAKQFDRRSGMINDMIHGILEDNTGCLWLSSNKGLIKYNPENDTFHNQSQADILITEFSDDAYWKCPYTGRLFFGGINGLVWLDPSMEPADFYDPELRFWDVSMLGGTYYITDVSKPVVIPPEASIFTVSFIATDYIRGDNYEYTYKLEGFNDTWIELQKENKVTFTNLAHGKYHLRVKYKNDVYSSDVREYILPIVVSPYWYLTNTAKFVYIIVLLLVIILVTWQLLHNWRNKQLLLTQHIKEEQQKKLYDAKLNFFTNITHELCTPLTLINGATDHLRQYREGKGENYNKYIGLLQENVKGLNELIQEILDFRKIEESGFKEPQLKRYNLTGFFHSQMKSFVTIAEENEIDFEVQVDEQITWYTDLSFLKKIINNLVSNAFKYVNKNGYVRISLKVIDGTLKMQVYNSGLGIEASMIPELLDRYRVLEHLEENKYMQMTAQHGLGLSICNSLVGSLQGEIKIASEIDKYVEVTVVLPDLEDEFSTAIVDETEEEDEMNPVLAGGNPERPVILVVDDNKDIVWFIADTLSKDYEIRKAYNATDALQMIRKRTPELIITDIIMPDVDGLAFIRQIKANKFSRHIPVIIISAKITDEEQAEGLNLGADAYLTKPFSAIILHSTVNRLISNKEKMKEYYHSPESAYVYTEGQLLHQEDKEFMDDILQIIRENLDKENLRPELIAEKMGLNSRNLYRRFKKISNLSPSDLIKDYRFTYAAQLLVSTNLNIQEIIYKVGITNKSYFYREFYKKYQLTPKEYRSRS